MMATEGELRVLFVPSDGQTPEAIAVGPRISSATVRTHVKRLYEKTAGTGKADRMRRVSPKLTLVLLPRISA